MKKIMSLLAVTVRSTIYKMMLILLAMSVVQLGMFWRTYLKYDYSEQTLSNSGVMLEIPGEELLGQAFGVSWTLESLVEKSKVAVVFLAAFALICLVLYWAESERKGTNTFYFYDRLSITKKQRIISLSIYNLASILLLIFAEVLTVLGMGKIFEYLVPAEYESVQMYFMALYKSEFLHCLLPMADIFKWIRNIILFAACALEIASSACQRRKTWGVFLIIILIIFGFMQKIGTFGAVDIIMILTAGVCIAVDVYKIWFGGQGDDI